MALIVSLPYFCRFIKCGHLKCGLFLKLILKYGGDIWGEIYATLICLFEMNWLLIFCGLLRLPSVKLFKNGGEADVTEESRGSVKTLTKMLVFDRLQTKFAKLYTAVSHFVHRRGQGSASGGGSASREGWADPPPHIRYYGISQRQGGTHPTGMHFCFASFQIN